MGSSPDLRTTSYPWRYGNASRDIVNVST